MDIGKKIKELRKSKNITQEQLANALSVSSQAVSKWENGISLPDVTTIPVIAAYFNISIDELFDYNSAQTQNEIESIVNEAYKFRESDYVKSRNILLEGLIRYPGNEILLNNLLYVTVENDEVIKIASNLVKTTKQNDIKYDALRFLAYAYKKQGKLDEAEAAIEQIPEIYFTKLTEKAYLFEDERKFIAAEKQKWISFENLIQMMQKLSEYYESIGDLDKAIKEMENALKLIYVEKNKSYDLYIEYFNSRISELKKKI